MQVPGGREGVTHDGLVELVDLLPTLLELGDVEAPHQHFGRSLTAVVHGSDVAVRDAAFSEGGFVPGEEYAIEPLLHGNGLRAQDPSPTRRHHARGPRRVIRTADWTYISRVYEGDELYDRRADPGERVNLCGRAGTEDVAAGLRTRLLEWMLATSDVVPHERDPRMDADIMAPLFAPR